MKRLSVIARKNIHPSLKLRHTISATATRPSLSSSSSHSRFYFSLFIFNSTIYDCRVSRKRVQFSRRARRDDEELIKIVDFFSFLIFPILSFTGIECCCYGCAWFPPNISHFILTRCTRRRHVYVPTLCRLLYFLLESQRRRRRPKGSKAAAAECESWN